MIIANNSYLKYFLFVVISGAIPIFSVDYLPCTDLPQHLVQTKVFFETFYEGSSVYNIDFWGVNTLIYYPMFVLWHFLSPLMVGKITVFAIFAAGAAAIFFMAEQRNRPVENAVLASILLFNSSFYWGFLPFMSGWPVFAIFWVVSNQNERNFKWQTKLFLLSFLLLFTHSLWLAAAVGRLIILAATEEKNRNMKAIRQIFLPLIPVCFYAGIWFNSYTKTKVTDGYPPDANYLFSFLEKFHPVFLAKTSNMSLNDVSIYLVLAALSCYLIISFFNRKNAGSWKIDRQLFSTSILGFAFCLVAPEYFLDTVFFSQRWLPYALILILLSAPPIGRLKKVMVPLSLICFVTISLYQTLIWREFEKNELSGLQKSIELLPENQKIGWVDLRKSSDYILFRPFYQLSAYSEVFKDSHTSYSFFCHANGIVRFKDQKINRILKDHPHNFDAQALSSDEFAYHLVNAKDSKHHEIGKIFPITDLTKEGCWRLYRSNL